MAKRKPKLQVRRARMRTWEWRIFEMSDGRTVFTRRRHPVRDIRGKFNDPPWHPVAVL